MEIQRKGAGAGAKRARHNSSLLDAHILKSGDNTEDIPDSYVIFIAENDVMKGNLSIYPVERYVTKYSNLLIRALDFILVSSEFANLAINTCSRICSLSEKRKSCAL